MTNSTYGEFLLEMYIEEIPSRMQVPAGEDILKILIERITNEGVEIGENNTFFVSPRRLTFLIPQMSLRTKARIIDKKGPKLNCNKEALEGFLKANNASEKDLVVKELAGHEHYVLEEKIEDKDVKEILPMTLPLVLKSYNWEKSMVWGHGEMTRWIRPVRNLLCILNGGRVDIVSQFYATNNLTFGHAFIDKGQVSIYNFFEYEQLLPKLHVIFDHRKRKALIKEQLEKLQKEHNIKLIEDEELLDEVTGLVEWPNIILAQIDEEFKFLPEEVLITTMRNNQKYFCFRDSFGRLSSYFAICANSLSQINDTVRNGNLRVLRARLNDAVYFFEKDKRNGLANLETKLEKISFHAKLGSVKEKVIRIKYIAQNLAKFIEEANLEDILTAANLCKNDLATEMVTEFPELQGIMGGYYSALEGASEEVSKAISEHYLPTGRNSPLPSTLTGIVIALADKIDSLYGLFLVGEKPTGSKDPFSLRRAMLGIIRIIISNNVSISIHQLIKLAAQSYEREFDTSPLVEFCLDRFISFMKEENYNHNIIEACCYNFSSINNTYQRILELTQQLNESEFLEFQVPALARLLSFKTDNIVNEISDNFILEEEKNLFALSIIAESGKLHDILSLAKPINEFFDKVMVNDPDTKIRSLRQALVAKCQKNVLSYADFGLLKLIKDNQEGRS